MYLQTKIR